MHPSKASLIAATILLSTLGITATAASFPCGRATTKVERMICANPELSTLDEQLGRYYAAANIELGSGATCLRDDQREWLRTRNACHDGQCLRNVYIDRLAELDALQHGATAIRQIELPAVPALVWVIHAALDTIAAPPAPKAPLLQARGRVINELEAGGGYLLRTDNDERLPLVLDMFLEPATATTLEALAREDAWFLARGHEAMDHGKRYFEPSRCVFLYRLPALTR